MSIKSIFEENCPDLVADKKLAFKIKNYLQQFINRNDDHINFFGGNLMGVHRVRFMPDDRNRWFDEIMEADDLAIHDQIIKLDDIVETRVVSSDVMNLSGLWLVHKFYNSSTMNEIERLEAMRTVVMILNCKFVTSILSHWFRFKADESVATATYAALSRKFGLKVHGSWGALLDARAADAVDPKGIHFKTYKDFDEDYEIVKMINDIQGRVKDILKNIRDVFETVHRDPSLVIKSKSNTVEIDGAMKVRDMSRMYPTYAAYFKNVVGDKNTLIKPELTTVVVKMVPSIPEKHLISALGYVSENSGRLGDKDVSELIDTTLTHVFDYLSVNKDALKNKGDVAGLISKMKALYMASRTTDPVMLKMRMLGERIVGKSCKTKNGAVIAAVRTGILLYIVLRTFTMNYYSK